MRRYASILILCAWFMTGSVATFAENKRSDDQIYNLVRQRLANDPDIKGGALQVEVKDGVVTISGEVDKERARQKAEKVAHKVKGVKSVENKLQLKK